MSDPHYSQLYRVAPDIAAAEFEKRVVFMNEDVDLLEKVRELPYADVYRGKMKRGGTSVSVKVPFTRLCPTSTPLDCSPSPSG